MRTYIRVRNKGCRYFFTVNLAERQNNNLLIDQIEHLRAAFKETRRDHLFTIEGIVILPDHLHCIWSLPPDDEDFSTRWRLIKSLFSRRIEAGERITKTRQRKNERGIWQRRFWEHAIRDERDYQTHLDYIHYNPVKHGYADAPKDWPYSSFRRCVAHGFYPVDSAAPIDITQLSME